MTTPAITSTGLKGFLQWLQVDQPAIYQAAAAKIQKAVPKGFSNYNGSVVQNMRLSQGRRAQGFRGFGDDTSDFTPDLTAVGLDSTYATSGIDFGSDSDTSDAANSGTTDASTLTGVANIISSVSGAVLSQQQQQTYNNIVQTQLQRAQQGLPPLNLTSSASGLPLISGLSSGSSSLVWLGGAAVLLYLLVGRKRA